MYKFWWQSINCVISRRCAAAQRRCKNDVKLLVTWPPITHGINIVWLLDGAEVYVDCIHRIHSSLVRSALVLEGSKTSYAQFKKWDGGTNSSLSFEFRTESSDGLLLYTDDPSTCDSLELKLVEGRLRLRMNTGTGPMILQSSPSLPSLADGVWHRVAVVKLSANTTLQVRSCFSSFSF